MSGTVVCVIVEAPGNVSPMFLKTALTMFCGKNMVRGKVSGTFLWRVGGRKGPACGFLCASGPCGLPLLQVKYRFNSGTLPCIGVVRWWNGRASCTLNTYLKKVQALNFKPVWSWNFDVAAKRAQQWSTAQADSAIETDTKIRWNSKLSQPISDNCLLRRRFPNQRKSRIVLRP